MKTHLAAALPTLLLLIAAAAVSPSPGINAVEVRTAGGQDDPEKVHIRMHRKIAPSVVFVSGGSQSGTGVCIDKEGFILTSPTACGTASERVTVIASGHRQYEGRVIGRRNDKELVIVK